MAPTARLSVTAQHPPPNSAFTLACWLLAGVHAFAHGVHASCLPCCISWPTCPTRAGRYAAPQTRSTCPASRVVYAATERGPRAAWKYILFCVPVDSEVEHEPGRERELELQAEADADARIHVHVCFPHRGKLGTAAEQGRGFVACCRRQTPSASALALTLTAGPGAAVTVVAFIGIGREQRLAVQSWALRGSGGPLPSGRPGRWARGRVHRGSGQGRQRL